MFVSLQSTDSPCLLVYYRAKIKNIEETEDAKQKLIKERMTKKEDVSEFVPTNMAVNFVQHNRCKNTYYHEYLMGMDTLLREIILTWKYLSPILYRLLLKGSICSCWEQIVTLTCSPHLGTN